MTSIEYVESCAPARESKWLRSEIAGDTLLDLVSPLDEAGVSALPGDAFDPGATATNRACARSSIAPKRLASCDGVPAAAIHG